MLEVFPHGIPLPLAAYIALGLVEALCVEDSVFSRSRHCVFLFQIRHKQDLCFLFPGRLVFYQKKSFPFRLSSSSFFFSTDLVSPGPVIWYELLCYSETLHLIAVCWPVKANGWTPPSLPIFLPLHGSVFLLCPLKPWESFPTISNCLCSRVLTRKFVVAGWFVTSYFPSLPF